MMTRGLKAAFLPFFLVLASPLEAQRFDIGLTAPQCEAIVANALANPTRLADSILKSFHTYVARVVKFATGSLDDALDAALDTQLVTLLGCKLDALP